MTGGYRWSTDDIGVFWDFASLPQPDSDGKRTEAEDQAFKRGLKVINLLYGAKGTLVIQLKGMPEPFTDSEGNPSNGTAYNDRGWCFFEETAACIQKDNGQLLDLTGAMGFLEKGGETRHPDFQRLAHSVKAPPLDPADFAKELASRAFTSGADRDKVADIYRAFFEEVAATVDKLVLDNRHVGSPGWDDAQLKQFLRALPAFTSCTSLSIQGHAQLTKECLGELGDALRRMPALRFCGLPAHLQHSARFGTEPGMLPNIWTLTSQGGIDYAWW